MLDSSIYIENLWNNKKLEPSDVSDEQKLHNFLDELTIEFQQIYQEKQDEVNKLEVKLQSAEDIFKSNLDSKSQKLNEIHIQVQAAMTKFKQASETAVRIGDRLASTESERKTLVRAIDIIKTIDVLERIEPVKFQEKIQDSLNFMTIKNSLSDTLRKKDVKNFCLLLQDIRKVLIDIKSDDVSKAQTNVIALSQLVESELLVEFDSSIVKLSQYMSATTSTTAPSSSSSSSSIENNTSNANNQKIDVELQILKQTQNLVECLYTFSEGQSLEKRYLFHVVQFMFKDTNRSRNYNNKRIQSPSKYNRYNDEEDDEEDMAGDRLSKLFGCISKICKEQFEVISKVCCYLCI